MNPATRAERIAAALAELEAEREAERRRGTSGAGVWSPRQAGDRVTGGCRRRPRRSRRPRARLERARAARAAQIAALERAAPGRWWRAAAATGPGPGWRTTAWSRPPAPRLAKAEAGPEAAERKAAARKETGPVRNITDPDSRLMPVRGGGFIQGYNAQNVTSEDG